MKNPAHPAYSHVTEQFRQPPSLPPKSAHPDCRLSERFNFHNIATKGGLRAQVCALRRETRAGAVQSPAPSQACISSGRASRNCRRKADDNGSVTGTGLHPSNSRAAVRTRADRLIGLHFCGGAPLSRNFNRLRQRKKCLWVTFERKYPIFQLVPRLVRSEGSRLCCKFNSLSIWANNENYIRTNRLDCLAVVPCDLIVSAPGRWPCNHHAGSATFHRVGPEKPRAAVQLATRDLTVSQRFLKMRATFPQAQ